MKTAMFRNTYWLHILQMKELYNIHKEIHISSWERTLDLLVTSL